MGKDIRKELARLKGIKENRTYAHLEQRNADEYNTILDGIQLKGFDVVNFRILPEDFRPVKLACRVLSGRPVEQKWSEPRLVRSTFHAKLDGVLDYLDSEVGGDGAVASDAMAILSSIGEHFGIFVHQLGQRQRSRTPIVVQDEYDMQDLLHALLRLHFDDVRPEDWVPSYAGKNSRLDFLIPKEAVVVEAKCVRDAKHARDVGEEITLDAAKYDKHPDCERLVAIVYDPGRHIGNPSGLKTDLETLKIKGNLISVYICN